MMLETREPKDFGRGAVLFWVQLIFLVLAFLFVLLRAYVKVFMVKKVQLDDWFMFAAMVSSPQRLTQHSHPNPRNLVPYDSLLLTTTLANRCNTLRMES